MYTTTQVVCEKTSSTTLVTLSFIIPTHLLILICIYCLYTLYILSQRYQYTRIQVCCSEIAVLASDVINKETTYLT